MSRKFDPRAYCDPAPQPWLIRALGPVNRVGLLRGLLRLREFDLPAADLARLRRAVNPATVAFLGPNHPEFTTDWLIDKEISRLCSPLMAHWASYEIVNGSPATQAFWLANNLVANAPGGAGKEYSVRWALQGHAVLLHPEGTATWQGERTSPLLPGIVDMAWDAATRLRDAGQPREVYVVPLVWRLRFLGDASDGLQREMAKIERALGLAPARGREVGERFAALLRALLVRQCRQLGLPSPPDGKADYFAAQAATITTIRSDLARRHGEFDSDMARAQHLLRRSIRRLASTDATAAQRDGRLLAELQRLNGFDPALYDRPTLSQEQVAENLKRVRSALVTRGLANAAHNLLPVAVAPRAVHLRVPEPLAIHAAVRLADGEAAKLQLMRELHARLQGGIDALGRELAPALAAHPVPNPLATGAAVPR